MKCHTAAEFGLGIAFSPAFSIVSTTNGCGICDMSRPTVYMAKEAVNRAYESTLAEGVRFERRLFHGLFGTEDQKEGMSAFVEKRPGNWKGR
mgnify:CR=1 FL=1